MKVVLPGMKVVAHSFAPRDFVGGNIALDFANTVTARDAHTPIDWLDGYPRLIEWALLAELVSTAEARSLLEFAQADTRSSSGALARARSFREAIYVTVSSMIDGNAATRMLKTIDQAWKSSVNSASLEVSDELLIVRHNLERSGLNLITDRVSLAAIALLQNLPLSRARICGGERCGWVFIDSSKAGRRIWCDMATCGNAAKTKRHRIAKTALG